MSNAFPKPGIIATLLVALAVAGCTGATPRTDARAPTDTGNMAYPAPAPQGNITTTHP